MGLVTSETGLAASARILGDGLNSLVDALRRRGFGVVAPVVSDSVITLAIVESADEIPSGWSDTQQPGHYRAEAGDGPLRFGHAAPAQPWKRYLHEPRTLLVRSRIDGSGDARAAAAQPEPLAFVGIQSCDLAAIARLDAVLERDEAYHRRREGLFIVAVACTSPASTCFCASAGTGPMPGDGADIVLGELDDGTLLATAHSARGAELLDAAGATEAASRARVALVGQMVDDCAAAQTRALDQHAIDAAAATPDHPGWADVAARCLTCGNCTFQCPTCFCTSTDDVTPLDGESVERWQRWDSCFSLDFSYIHGGPVRPGATSRYRQWYLHKLVTWHDQFGESGCVGCGRCITWCPTGIDITEAVIT
ncbi:MAG: 4Fe-4S dicluster domain-containing protein [Acidimicrobiia bacterium]|nr:4Fe-4S dicluster domain-containing protein [Acidimicrobiia bacterium]